MTEECLTALLAQRIMGWSIGPDRFMTGKRRWMPRWRFQPFLNVVDAFTLLDAAKPSEYVVSSSGGNQIEARVRIGKRTGEAVGETRADVVTRAVARALGLEVTK